MAGIDGEGREGEYSALSDRLTLDGMYICRTQAKFKRKPVVRTIFALFM